MNKAIERLIIINRGEIAARIIRTARRMGIHTIAVYSEADANALHTRMADEAWPLGSNDLSSSYLDIPKLIDIAKRSHADALHPGYGFLAENPELVKACEKSGIIFLGPGPEAMLLMGNKIHAREFVRGTGAPLIEGYTGTPEELVNMADPSGYPYLVKAAAGGGGKGMRIAHDAEELIQHLASTSREAKSYFGDGTVYLERYLEEPRHIEIQVLGDTHGNMVYLFERECSVQRRYQKIIEEAPSPTVDATLRAKMGETAVSIAKAIGYVGAGTMEFLVDKQLNYYFLEMNTRIQVEHPVTEMITGIDIVEEQIHIGEGLPLPFKQEVLSFQGHAIEFRIYAEDAMNDFMPSPGRISYYLEPNTNGIRIDSALDGEDDIHGFYDPMISKLVVHGKDRETALRKGREALVHYAVHGIRTNIPLLYLFTTLDDFKKNRIHTKYCDLKYAELKDAMIQHKEKNLLGSASVCFLASLLSKPLYPCSVWEEIGYWRHYMEIPLKIEGRDVQVKINDFSRDQISIGLNGDTYEGTVVRCDGNDIQVIMDDYHHRCILSYDDNGTYHLSMEGNTYSIVRRDELCQTDFYVPPEQMGGAEGGLTSPMPGKVLKINIKAGDQVKKGQVLVVVEAMKMENNIVAPSEGVVAEVNVAEGDTVDTKKQLVIIDKTTEQ